MRIRLGSRWARTAPKSVASGIGIAGATRRTIGARDAGVVVLKRIQKRGGSSPGRGAQPVGGVNAIVPLRVIAAVPSSHWTLRH